MKIPFLTFSRKETIKDNPFFAPQEVIEEPMEEFLQGPNPLLKEFPLNLKETVVFYKSFTNKVGDLAEKTVNQTGCLLKKITNQKFPMSTLPSLDQADFEKPLYASLQVAQKLCPKEFLKLTGRGRSEREITKKLGKLLACLQHFDIPHYGLSKTFNLSGVDSLVKQLKLIDKSVLVFIKRKTDFSENESRALYNAVVSIKDLQNLLKEYQGEINRPIDEKDRIFVKSSTENKSIVDAVILPTVIKLGSILLPFITIDYVPYMASKAISLLINSPESPSLMPDLEEDQESTPRFMINTLANQVFMCALAYIGARMCGSKTKVKEFVEQRISSVLAYKACNYSFDYLRVPFWPNKTVCSIVSGCANPLLNLSIEDPI